MSEVADRTRLSVHLLRPAAGATVLPGSRINGIGWVVSDVPVGGIDLYLDTIRLGRARLGLSASDLNKQWSGAAFAGLADR